MPDRRSVLKLVGALGVAPAAVALQGAAKIASAEASSARISRYQVDVARVPVHERVRESLVGSFARQGRLQDHFQSVMVRLHSDAGAVGIGEAMMPAAQAEEILKRMVGRSPWEFLLDDSLGGILIAVYDLVGHLTGLPVSKLFSPRPKQRIVQTWWSQCYPPPEMASEAKLGYELGYRVHKIKVRPWQDPVEQMAAISDVVPADMRIWADANSWWGSVGRTLFFAGKLSQFQNLFAIETPFRRQHLEGHRQLKGKLPILLSEHIEGLDVMTYLREALMDAFIIGAPRLGQTMVRHNAMAELASIPLWVEHSIQTGVAQVFQAHQAAAFPGVEYCISITHCLQDDLMKEAFQMKNGFYSVPDGPGLGVTLDEDALDRYRVV